MKFLINLLKQFFKKKPGKLLYFPDGIEVEEFDGGIRVNANRELSEDELRSIIIKHITTKIGYKEN